MLRRVFNYSESMYSAVSRMPCALRCFGSFYPRVSSKNRLCIFSSQTNTWRNQDSVIIIHSLNRCITYGRWTLKRTACTSTASCDKSWRNFRLLNTALYHRRQTESESNFQVYLLARIFHLNNNVSRQLWTPRGRTTYRISLRSTKIIGRIIKLAGRPVRQMPRIRRMLVT
jgi:hypothetical protein